MVTSTIPTQAGTLQTPTTPTYVTIENNKSKAYPNGQKLLQVHMHFTSNVSADWTILGIPEALRTNVYVSVPITNANTGETYGALINGNTHQLILKKAAPSGWYGVCVLYE